ncbi:MAG: alpha/beta hydrolase [Chloroflexota bacterium]|nr:MAG: alpha/beta hydrolase [Chloroflexota bacterium]
MTYPLLEFGGAGPLLHLAVANGFPPQTYTPLLKPLADRCRLVCLPPRALWPGENPPERATDWRMLADDLLAGMARHSLTDVIAVGHSFGGVASLLAALAEPRRFRALCLLDPTILPPPAMQAIDEMRANGGLGAFPLVQGALRRRRFFSDVEEAFVYFRTKTLFLDWTDAALRLYVEHGTRPAAGGGLELAWPPEWEAYYFSAVYTGTWADLPRLRGQLPVLVVRGANSDTLLPEAAALIRALLPDAAYAEIPGHGHLFPQTAPDATRRVIENWLDGLPL